MTKQTPLTADARKAFAVYRGLGRHIIDDLIAEVERLTDSHAALLAAAEEALPRLLFGSDAYRVVEAAIAQTRKHEG